MNLAQTTNEFKQKKTIPNIVEQVKSSDFFKSNNFSCITVGTLAVSTLFFFFNVLCYLRPVSGALQIIAEQIDEKLGGSLAKKLQWIAGLISLMSVPLQLLIVAYSRVILTNLNYLLYAALVGIFIPSKFYCKLGIIINFRSTLLMKLLQMSAARRSYVMILNYVFYQVLYSVILCGLIQTILSNFLIEYILQSRIKSEDWKDYILMAPGILHGFWAVSFEKIIILTLSFNFTVMKMQILPVVIGALVFNYEFINLNVMKKSASTSDVKADSGFTYPPFKIIELNDSSSGKLVSLVTRVHNRFVPVLNTLLPSAIYPAIVSFVIFCRGVYHGKKTHYLSSELVKIKTKLEESNFRSGFPQDNFLLNGDVYQITSVRNYNISLGLKVNLGKTLIKIIIRLVLRLTDLVDGIITLNQKQKVFLKTTEKTLTGILLSVPLVGSIIQTILYNQMEARLWNSLTISTSHQDYFNQISNFCNDVYLIDNIDEISRSIRLTVNRLYFRGISIERKNSVKAGQETLEELLRAGAAQTNSFNSFKPALGNTLASFMLAATIPLVLNISQVLNFID